MLHAGHWVVAVPPSTLEAWDYRELMSSLTPHVITINNKQQQSVFLKLSLMEIPKQQPKHSNYPLVP